MRPVFNRGSCRLGAVVVAVAAGSAISASGGGVPPALTRAFEFPVSLGSAVTGPLVRPIGTAPSLTFRQGTVAVGALPVPLPAPLARVRRLRNQSPFFLPTSDSAPHARLLLIGVVDAQGTPVTNTGNHFSIDGEVSPGSTVTPPPFVIPFDITDGMAYVDAALPIQPQLDAAAFAEVTAVSVSDPRGQVFGVLGFRVASPAATPTPSLSSTPGTTPSPQVGHCFAGPDCMGPSFHAPQNVCCHFTRSGANAALATSWCPPDQFDPSTGSCPANACAACGNQIPTPTPGTNGCGTGPACNGSCTGTCPDGTVAAGTCRPSIFNGPIVLPGSPPQIPSDLCQCVLNCTQPPTPTPGTCGTVAQCGGPCSFGCSDGTVVRGHCTVLVIDPPGQVGQPFGPTCTCIADCPSPPSPTPGACGAGNACQGTCTATCADGTTAIGTCVDVRPVSGAVPTTCTCVAACNQQPTPTPQCASVPCGGTCAIIPLCLPGAACPNVVIAGECRIDASGSCQCQPGSPPIATPLPICHTDADCTDDDACTNDHCVNGVCEHACICLNASGTPACCPGPAALCARPCGADASGVCGGVCPTGAACESVFAADGLCRCVSDVGGPCGGNILALRPVCASGLICKQSLPDIAGVCVKPSG